MVLTPPAALNDTLPPPPPPPPDEDTAGDDEESELPPPPEPLPKPEDAALSVTKTTSPNVKLLVVRFAPEALIPVALMYTAKVPVSALLGILILSVSSCVSPEFSSA